MNTSSLPKKRAGTGVPETIELRRNQKHFAGRILLFCGILSSLWYVAVNLVVPPYFPGYNQASQVVSELSAVGAPTRSLWTALAAPYTVLVIAFGWGVRKAAGSNRRLRTTGTLLFAYGALGILWPFAPMHLRETVAAGGATWTDTAHIALGAATEILYVFALGFAAAALGRSFRVYSILTFLALLVFGTLTFLEAPGIAANQPTPLIGVWERINIGVFLLWIVVLAVLLLRKEKNAVSATAASKTE